jgi:hypothetical protein
MEAAQAGTLRKWEQRRTTRAEREEEDDDGGGVGQTVILSLFFYSATEKPWIISAVRSEEGMAV